MTDPQKVPRSGDPASAVVVHPHPCSCSPSYPANVCPFHDPSHPDYAVIQEESAIAQAQAVVSQAIVKSGLSRSEIARRIGRHHSAVSTALKGEHNLTVRMMARLLTTCGFGVRFELVPLADCVPEDNAK